jgi:hypothetical protein
MPISHTGNPEVTAALATMAMFRQADPSELTLNLYSAELEARGIDPAVAIRACQAIQETPRRDGQTAFPDLGTLLDACVEAKQALYRERLEVLAAQAPKQLLPPASPPMTRAEAKSFVAKLRSDVEANRVRHD